MSESWIGGDISGIQAMGTTLTGAREDLDGVVKPLSGKVDSLVGDAGWQGDSAEEFRGKWSEDAITAGGLADLIGSVGSVLTELGGQLAAAESALYNAADAARGKGVAVGPRGEPLEMVTANPPSPKERQAITELNSYGEVYRQITYTAQQARVQAAEQLKRLFDDIDPNSPMKTADKATASAFLRDLYAAKDDRGTAQAEEARSKLDSASKGTQDAWARLNSERQALKAAGKDIPHDLPEDAAYHASIKQVKALNSELEAAEANRGTFDRTLNYKLADAARDLKMFEGLDRLPEFLRDIPVLDIAAAGVVGVTETQEDHDKGWSWTHSALVDGGAALGGLAVGAAVVASLPEDAAAGVLALGAGGVMFGVYAVDKAFHEHWSEDIHDHGIIGGVAQGSWNVVKGAGTSIVDDAKGMWHGVTSLF
ncbi:MULTISPECIES: WXG100 family type VII secretion target [Streptacidiphilus]|uniref:WXG100 family type VII secretion target n=1 Tax=Streptacidiphilus cavernicola TaxID=3342716 RepID=A0ABV6UZ27_9ACTN|nr:hypothetical protein [Streptacidiphilus jeojiense]